MDNLLESIKSKFLEIGQFAIWVFSVLAAFIFPPQIENFPDDTKVLSNLAKFILTALIGFLYIPFSRYKKRKYLVRWYIISILSLVIGILSYYYYDSIRQTKRIEYQAKIFVVGDYEDLTPEARELKREVEPPRLSNSDLIKYFAPEKPEDLMYIWNESGIKANRLLIISIYLITVIFFTIFMLTLIQAINCLPKKNKKVQVKDRTGK